MYVYMYIYIYDAAKIPSSRGGAARSRGEASSPTWCPAEVCREAASQWEEVYPLRYSPLR